MLYHLSEVQNDAHAILSDLLTEAANRTNSADHYGMAKEIVRLLQFVSYDKRVILSDLLDVPPK
jgi:hypothetical protein